MTWSKRWVIHSLILCRTTAQLKETDTPVTTLAADCVTFTIQLSLLPVLCPWNAPIKVSPLWLSTCALEDTAASRGSALACRPKGNQGPTGLRKWFHSQKKKLIGPQNLSKYESCSNDSNMNQSINLNNYNHRRGERDVNTCKSSPFFFSFKLWRSVKRIHAGWQKGLLAHQYFPEVGFLL